MGLVTLSVIATIFVGAALWATAAQLLVAKHVDEHKGEFAGAGEAFLSQLPSA